MKYRKQVAHLKRTINPYRNIVFVPFLDRYRITSAASNHSPELFGSLAAAMAARNTLERSYSSR